ncbi:hypothetical protein TEA_016664 [Camellia sinensis var. sinensis]|uniref:Uncharacterized protein n=1 Tax=Camellia sinensis var. sinensis TaxID=542762 RepID=A0A4S4E494_CAMSN|nr:hypothetical protein TEA_016664 [Camellia sinensis var. sinensis]
MAMVKAMWRRRWRWRCGEDRSRADCESRSKVQAMSKEKVAASSGFSLSLSLSPPCDPILDWIAFLSPPKRDSYTFLSRKCGIAVLTPNRHQVARFLQLSTRRNPFAINEKRFPFRLFLYRTALIYVLKKWLHWVEDRVHVYQFFKVPELNENSQENQFYRKVFAYLNSLASIEDSDFTNLFAGRKSNDIVLCLDDNQTVHDEFLGARVSWKNEIGRGNEKSCTRTLVLRIKKKDKRRILRPYLQHIHKVSDEIEQRRREVRLFMNTHSDHHRNGRWISVPFTHPSSFDTIVMDSDLKNKVKSDLESFLKSKQYYHRLGRVWKRSFLLYGPSGTGKSSFVAAMAKFLCYDVFDVDLFRVTDDSDLKMLLLQTTSKSIISSAAEFSGELGGGGNKDGGVPAIKEIRKLYGILRLRSSNKIGPSDHESTQIVK